MDDMRPKVKAGWLYKWPRTNEQRQGFCIPVMDDDGTIMLADTYMIRNRSIDDIIGLGHSPHGWEIREAISSHYYGHDNVRRCHDDVLPSDVEPVCELREWRIVADIVARDYADEDVIGPVQLFFEHGWRSVGRHGVMLVRRNATKSPVAMMLALDETLNEHMRMPLVTKGDIERMMDAVRKAGPAARPYANQILSTIERMRLCVRMRQEYDELTEMQRKRGARREHDEDEYDEWNDETTFRKYPDMIANDNPPEMLADTFEDIEPMTAAPAEYEAGDE